MIYNYLYLINNILIHYYIIMSFTTFNTFQSIEQLKQPVLISLLSSLLNFNFETYSGTTVMNSGTGTNGTLTNSSLITTSGSATGTSSLILNGTTDYMTIPAFNLTNNGYSVAFWFKTNSISQWTGIFALGIKDKNEMCLQIMIGSSNTLTYWISPSNYKTIQFASNMNSNVWTHVVFTHSPITNAVIAYINGAAGTSYSCIYPSIITNNYCVIGTQMDPNYKFNGGVDDFRFDQKVLTPSQANNIYNGISF
jgi:hypothetical protein